MLIKKFLQSVVMGLFPETEKMGLILFTNEIYSQETTEDGKRLIHFCWSGEEFYITEKFDVVACHKSESGEGIARLLKIMIRQEVEKIKTITIEADNISGKILKHELIKKLDELSTVNVDCNFIFSKDEEENSLCISTKDSPAATSFVIERLFNEENLPYSHGHITETGQPALN